MNFIAALRKVTESIKAWVEARVTSWNDLTDKPFGEKKIVEVNLSEDIVFEVPSDGVTASAWLDYVIPLEVGANYVIYVDGNRYEGVAADTGYGETYFDNIGDQFYVKVSEQSDGQMSAHFEAPKAGTYTVKIAKIEETVTTVPTEMLPEHLQFGESDDYFHCAWDGVREDGVSYWVEHSDAGFYKVSDKIFTKEEAVGAIVKFTNYNYEDGVTVTLTEEHISEFGVSSDSGTYEAFGWNAWVGDYSTYCVKCIEKQYEDYEPGLYFFCNPNQDPVTWYTHSFTLGEIKTIDAKYLPPTIIDFNATEVEGEDGEWYIQTSVSMTADELRAEAESGRTLVAKVFGSLLPMKYIDSLDDGLEIGFGDESIIERNSVYAYMWTEEDGTVGCEAGFVELAIPRITSFYFEAGITKYDDFNDRPDRDSINSISVEFIDGTTRVNDLYTIVDSYFWSGLSTHPIYTDYLYTDAMAIKQENNYAPSRNPHLGMLHLLFDKNTRMFYRALFVPNTYFYLSSSTEGSTKQFKITVDDSGTLTATEVTE